MTESRLHRRRVLGAAGAAGLAGAARAFAQPAGGRAGCPSGSTLSADGACVGVPLTQPVRPLPRGAGGPPPPPLDGDVPRGAPDPAYASGYDRDPRREPDGPPTPSYSPQYPATTRAETYERGEIVRSASDFLGVTAEAVGAAVERAFRENGRPTAYIAGEEASGAVAVGLRYGKGLLYMKRRAPETVYWQGPSIGWDFGGNGSRSFTLCYNLQYPEMIYRRFPGVEGSAYFIGGLGVNYQRADDITLAPMRAGVGLRLGAAIGYLSYSRRRHWIPF